MTPTPAHGKPSVSPAFTPASGHAGGEADQLIDMLTRQRDLYRSLDGLSGKQQQIIATGQAEQLLAVLSERQVIVDQLTKINQDLAPLRGRMTEIADATTDVKRQSLRTLVDQVQAMLESIIERDEEDRQTLEASKAQVGQELAKVTTAPAAINAYKANAYKTNAYAKTSGFTPPAARFTDSRG